MKILIAHWNNILVDVEKALWQRGHTVLNSNKFLPETDILILWNEMESSGRPFIRKAHKLGKKVVLVQHGKGGTIRYYPPFHEKLLSDKICVWGEGEKRRMIKTGTPAEKIEVVGCPLLKHLKPRVEHNGTNILFCPAHWCSGEIDENLIVAGELRKLGINIITKVLKGEHEPSWYDNPIISDRRELGHLDTLMDTISKADLVVSIAEGTLEGLAEVLDIPVVLADIWIPKSCAGDDRYLKYKKEATNACKKTNLDNLNKVILQQLKSPDELKEERKKTALEDMGVGIKNPVENIIKVIENI